MFTDKRYELCQKLKTETNPQNIIEIIKEIVEINKDISRHKNVWETLLNKFHSDCSILNLEWNGYVLSYKVKYPDGYVSENTIDTLKHNVMLY